jgi:hypothetical protein
MDHDILKRALTARRQVIVDRAAKNVVKIERLLRPGCDTAGEFTRFWIVGEGVFFPRAFLLAKSGRL